MVFSKMLKNITDLFFDENKVQKQKTKQPLNQLSQGLVYLQNKQKKFNELTNSSLLLEQFDTKNLDDVSRRELAILEKLKGDYDKKLSSYSTLYKNFMESYHSATKDVVSCKADCQSRHRPGTTNWEFSKIACQAGCDLNGPYIAKCKDTYLGSRVNGEKCDVMTKNKCSNGSVELGMIGDVTNINYADTNDVTIKDGCCECGGGVGGPPTSTINANKVTKCEDVPSALGLSAANGTFAVNRCHQARVKSAATNKQMWQSYQNLTQENEALIKLANNIFNKIKQLRSADENINNKIKDEETHLKNQLALYESVYANIKNYDTSKQVTVEGQVEDALLKEKSQSLHLIIWLGLAILTLSLVIHRMRK